MANRCYPAIAGILLILSVTAALSEPGELRYRVYIEGVSRDLRLELRDISDAVAFMNKPPASKILLRRRAERDIDRFRQHLRTYAYYDARISVRVDTERTPVRVYFDVEKGPLYELREVTLDWRDRPEEGEDRLDLPTPARLGLRIGDPAGATDIRNAENNLVAFLKRRGFPFARVQDREVVVDHRTRDVSVTYAFESGPVAEFGTTEIRGLDRLKEDYLRRQIPWSPGDPYNHDTVRRLQRRLIESQLYASVRVAGDEALDEDGRLPMVLDLQERKPRSVGIGIRYATDEGWGGKFTWEHRNRFGRGERLDLSGLLTEIGYAVELGFRKPDFVVLDQILRMTLRLSEEDTDAFVSRNYRLSAMLERQITRELVLGQGIGFKYSEVDQLDRLDRFSLLSFPAQLDWDTSNDLFHPTRGGRLSLRGVPFLDVSDTDLHFLRGRAGYTRYVRVRRRPEMVLAGRVMAGSIVGVSRENVPADERFYAGGGGSVRGYAYQSVGPLEGDVPLGGRSLLVMSAEWRVRATERIGFSIFTDGGSVYEDAVPRMGEDMRWGTGAGLRYFTPIGPLRLDVAVPLNRRREIDDSFQIYISIGQAF